MISTRLILLQIIPPLSILSVYAITNSATPPFVFQHANKHFSPFIFKDALIEAAEEEMTASAHTLSAKEREVFWTIYCRSVSLFWSKSRLIQYITNTYQFIFAISILYVDPVSQYRR